MPPWVARQCHVWRCSRPVQGSVYSRAPVNRRFFAQTPTRYDGASFEIKAPKAAVMIPSSVADTRPEDILSQIEPLPRSHAMRYRFAVFFVTPSFARWLLDDSVFLHKALTKMYSELLTPNTRPRVHALCAVVDRLPGPRPIENAAAMMTEGFQRIRDPPVEEIGHEGIAYAALPFHNSILTDPAKDQVKAAISFVSARKTADPAESPDLSDVIRIPLANTVFQTGSPTTMTYSLWAKGKGLKELTLKEKRDVSHHAIRMQILPDQNAMVNVPLIPLTRPRAVEASMGNILRRITGPDGESMPASQELEKVVPRFFAARREPSQATTVWAAVMNRDYPAPTHEWTDDALEWAQTSEEPLEEDKLWESLWKANPPAWNPLPIQYLSSGGRLHRVLSGGGGWGKKAGLLSLDPGPTPSSDPAKADQSDGPGDLSDALPQVAREGDSIQFFIQPSTKPDTSLHKVPEDMQVWGLELGTIPSTTDALPAATKATSKTNTITVYKDMFGALAEGGLVISRTFKEDGESSYGWVDESNIDVPFTRFSAINWVAEPKPGEDAEKFRSCLEPKVHLLANRDVLAKHYLAKGIPIPSFMNIHMNMKNWKDSLSPSFAQAAAPAKLLQGQERGKHPSTEPSLKLLSFRNLARAVYHIEHSVRGLTAALAKIKRARRDRIPPPSLRPRPQNQAQSQAPTPPARLPIRKVQNSPHNTTNTTPTPTPAPTPAPTPPARLPVRKLPNPHRSPTDTAPAPKPHTTTLSPRTRTHISNAKGSRAAARHAILAQRTERFRREGLRKYVSGEKKEIVKVVSGGKVWKVRRVFGGRRGDDSGDGSNDWKEEEKRDKQENEGKREREREKEKEKEEGKRELSARVMEWLR